MQLRKKKSYNYEKEDNVLFIGNMILYIKNQIEYKKLWKLVIFSKNTIESQCAIPIAFL